MEVKNYNPFVVKLKTKPKAKPKTIRKARGWGTKIEAPLSPMNKKELDTIYAKGFVRTSRKLFD